MKDIEVKLQQVAKATIKPKKKKIEPSLKFKNKLDEERFNRWHVSIAVRHLSQCDRVTCCSKVNKKNPEFKAVEGIPLEHYDLKEFMRK